VGAEADPGADPEAAGVAGVLSEVQPAASRSAASAVIPGAVRIIGPP
jgi:hypothetical protein